MSIHTDFLIIGAGPAGVNAANLLSKSGKKVVLVGKQLGGTYCYEGAVVSNSFLYISSLYDKYKLFSTNLAEGTPAAGKLDIKRAKKYVESVSVKVRKSFADELEKNNVHYIEGMAEFISPNEVLVKLNDNEKEHYTFDKCLVAVGSGNQKLGISFGKKMMDISAYSTMDSVPASVSIIGGGLIGAEVATFFSRLGAKVTIVEKGARILAGVDPLIVKKYEDSLKKRDINVITNKSVTAIERIGQKYIILFEDSKIESEEVFVCIGRTPFIQGLNIEAAGVTVIDGVPQCGQDLKTANENIYLAGDVTNLRMHAGWACHSASVAARNMMGEHIEYNSEAYPTVISSDPEIACVGMTEEEAKKVGYDVGVIKHTCSDFYKIAQPGGGFPAFIKAVYDKEDKRFLGVQVIGSGAAEIISTFALIIQSSIKACQLSNFVYISPVFNELLTEVAGKVK